MHLHYNNDGTATYICRKCGNVLAKNIRYE